MGAACTRSTQTLFVTAVILALCGQPLNVLSKEDPNDETSTLPSSCTGLEDGYYYLILLDFVSNSNWDGDDLDRDENALPIVHVKCHNEYIVLDPYFDPYLNQYFSSFLPWQSFVSGPTNEQIINWEQWYLPDDGDTNYIISPDCSTCEQDHNRQLYDSKTAYTMTGTMFGCFWIFLGEHNFDQDKETLQCYYNPYYSDNDRSTVGDMTPFELNDYSDIGDWDKSGVCAFNVRRADLTVNGNKHDLCTVDYSGEDDFTMEKGYHLKPSIGTQGQNCVCVKPSQTYEYDTTSVQKSAAEKRISVYLEGLESDSESTDEGSSDQTVYLYQNDFEDGTYRIKESGTYVIMEDIYFDFHAGTDDDPNGDDAWWPLADQDDVYPGAQSYRDPYFLGFWAGITVETDNVVIDLNKHSIQMTESFYFQQRWFTDIALESQYFLPGQGPGFFGADPSFPSHIVIKNGVLGLTSHHCIHGHYNNDILIKDVICKDFETHGIQFNGFNDLTLKDVDIGPSSDKAHLTGSYGHARNILMRLKAAQLLMDEDDTQSMLFDERTEEVSLTSLAEQLESQMNAVYTYAKTGEEPSQDTLSHDLWTEAKNLFYNPSGFSHGAGMYGIFLNTVGASVLTYNLQTSDYSENALLENVHVHDLHHSMIEFVRLSVPNSGSIFLNALHGNLDARQLISNLNDVDGDDFVPKYKGSILTDSTIALEHLTNHWPILQATMVWTDKIIPWSMGENYDALGEISVGCNSDAQTHGAKGLMGIRLDGVKDVTLRNVEIRDLYEETIAGSELCGSYRTFDMDCSGKCGGFIRQKAPMQVGFSGNDLQGIAISASSNVAIENKLKISDLTSHFGVSYGISIWPSVEITFDSKHVTVSGLYAGSKYSEFQAMYNTHFPNSPPQVCGVRFVESYYSSTTQKTYSSSVVETDRSLIKISNLDGFEACRVETTENEQKMITEDDDTLTADVVITDLKYTMIGKYKGNDNSFAGVEGGLNGIYNDPQSKHKSWFEKHKALIISCVVVIAVLIGMFCAKVCVYDCGRVRSEGKDENEININAELGQQSKYKISMSDDAIIVANTETTPLL